VEQNPLSGTLVAIVESYGEIPVKQNLRDIREGCDILVITVGRLEHFTRDEHVGSKWKVNKLELILLTD